MHAIKADDLAGDNGKPERTAHSRDMSVSVDKCRIYTAVNNGHLLGTQHDRAVA